MTTQHDMDVVIAFIEKTQHTADCSKRSLGMLIQGKPCDCGQEQSLATAKALRERVAGEWSIDIHEAPEDVPLLLAVEYEDKSRSVVVDHYSTISSRDAHERCGMKIIGWKHYPSPPTPSKTEGPPTLNDLAKHKFDTSEYIAMKGPSRCVECGRLRNKTEEPS